MSLALTLWVTGGHAQGNSVEDTPSGDQLQPAPPAASSDPDAPRPGLAEGTLSPGEITGLLARHSHVVNVNIPGRDLQTGIPVPDTGTCALLCAADTRCAAWTYVNPGVQADSAMCWKKGDVPPGRVDECCTSGLARR
ncbi:PAN domain-containing protein [Pseudoponticoccus marisrubri]|uniref:Apple domain-containing protein n=1 Tax=Pseudoponticoccus marisrubri TaxID=1685382 RepID=A0A0W7WED2_9RHOB|nr:PAN domain-containing protein [Pseudoponticoccus marisrubri]KUF08814.1 hypothetical protein AVJ23_20645 [Pseudoponticoccus marisrubri]